MRTIAFILFIFLISGCQTHHRQYNEITKIEFARSGAWSDMGAAISIDSSLTYKYFDGNAKKRYFVGKTSEKFWDTLNRKLEEINFRSLPLSDNKSVKDANYFEIIIYWKGGKKRLTRVREIKSDSILNTLLWINDSHKGVNLLQINNPIDFETTYQNEPPKPKIDRVKFPPPTKRHY